MDRWVRGGLGVKRLYWKSGEFWQTSACIVRRKEALSEKLWYFWNNSDIHTEHLVSAACTLILTCRTTFVSHYLTIHNKVRAFWRLNQTFISHLVCHVNVETQGWLCAAQVWTKHTDTWPNKDSESGLKQQHLPGVVFEGVREVELLETIPELP